MVQSPQLDLFPLVEAAFRNSPDRPLANAELYRLVGAAAGLQDREVYAKQPIGAAGQPRSPVTREIQWHQQALKARGILERVPRERGLWQLTEKAKRGMHRAAPQVTLLRFSTSLGLALFVHSPQVLQGLEERIDLMLTAPPYSHNHVLPARGPPQSTLASHQSGQARHDEVILEAEAILKGK